MSRFKVDNGGGSGFGALLYYKEGPQAQVDIHNEESLMTWQKSLQLTRQELLQAIREFGPGVKDIRRGLVNKKDGQDKAA
jgi:hypothetical protein